MPGSGCSRSSSTTPASGSALGVSLIELATFIAAPPERCFDLSLSVDVHLISTPRTGERVVAGPRSGLLGLGDVITWEARHFGVRRRLTVKITAVDRPHSFRDEQVTGPFRRMRHDHRFEPREGGTLMRDEFDVALIPVFDRLILRPHLRRFLEKRNEAIRRAAESDSRYLE